MNKIEFSQAPSSAEKNLLIEEISCLLEGETLMLRSQVNVEPLLSDIKKRRFQGLSWVVRSRSPIWEAEIKNTPPEDCCGCCGGS